MIRFTKTVLFSAVFLWDKFGLTITLKSLKQRSYVNIFIQSTFVLILLLPAVALLQMEAKKRTNAWLE